MSSVQQVLAGAGAGHRLRGAIWQPRVHGSELAWAIAFLVPYAAVFLAFEQLGSADGLVLRSALVRGSRLARLSKPLARNRETKSSGLK